MIEVYRCYWDYFDFDVKKEMKKYSYSYSLMMSMVFFFLSLSFPLSYSMLILLISFLEMGAMGLSGFVCSSLCRRMLMRLAILSCIRSVYACFFTIVPFIILSPYLQLAGNGHYYQKLKIHYYGQLVNSMLC